MKRLLVILLLFPIVLNSNIFEFSSFKADFTEKVYDEDSMEIAVIKGKVYLKKNNMIRMDIEKPEKQIIIVNKDSIMIYYKENNRISFTEIDKNNRLLLPSEIIFNTDSNFNVIRNKGYIKLTPIDSLIQIDSLILGNKREIGFIKIYTEYQRIEFVFKNEKTDIEINDKLFRFLRIETKNGD
jgi:outer membrane lipoprotein-sorting protein